MANAFFFKFAVCDRVGKAEQNPSKKGSPLTADT